MIHYLITELETQSAITDVVGNRIFSLSRLKDTQTPCLVLQMTGSQENESKGFHLNVVTCFVEITAITESPAVTWQLAVDTLQQLNGKKNSQILSSQFNQWASDVFESSELFTITLSFTIQIKIA